MQVKSTFIIPDNLLAVISRQESQFLEHHFRSNSLNVTT